MTNRPLHRRFFNYHVSDGTIGKVSHDYILKELKNLIDLKEMLGKGELEEESINKEEYYLDNNSIVSITEKSSKKHANVETAIFDKKYPINLRNKPVYGEDNYVEYLERDLVSEGFTLMSNQDGEIRTRFREVRQSVRDSYLNLLRKHRSFTEDQNFGELRLLINEPLFLTNVLLRVDVSEGYYINKDKLFLQSKFGGHNNPRELVKTNFNEITPNTSVYTPLSYSYIGGRSQLSKYYTQTVSMERMYNNLAVPNIYQHTKLCLGTTNFERKPPNPSKIQNSVHGFFSGVFNNDLSSTIMPLYNFKNFAQKAKMNLLDQEMLGTIPTHIRPYKRDILSFLDEYLAFLGAIEEGFRQDYVSQKETFIENYVEHFSHFENVNISHVRDFYESVETGEFEPIYQSAYMLLLISNLTSTPLDIMYLKNEKAEEVIKKGLFIYNNGEYVLN